MEAGMIQKGLTETGRLQASIEILPKQALASDALDALPGGTRVYLTDIGSAGGEAEMLKASLRIRDRGLVPVPHLAARRIASDEAFARRVGSLTAEGGVTDVLVIGGGINPPLGRFGSSIDLLETGVLDRHGITDIAVAGHPEGSPDFSDAVAIDALRMKHAFAERTGARLRIVTQFGFDTRRILTWAENLDRIGISLPIHLGVAGPAGIATLLKYSRLCGVGNSLSLFTRHAGRFTKFAAGYSPEAVVSPVEQHLRAAQSDIISQIHVFPFGGVEKAAVWLRERGSWPTDRTMPGSTSQAGYAR